MLSQIADLSIEKKHLHECFLDVCEKLVWNPSDFGLTRVHRVAKEWFEFESAAKKRLSELKESTHQNDNSKPLTIETKIDWLESVQRDSISKKRVKGVKFESMLKQYVLQREQVLNMVLDTIFISHPKVFGSAVTALTGIPLSSPSLQLVRGLKNEIGQPDQLFVDEASKTLLLVEIKVGVKTTKYSMNQHLKYLFLSQILGQLDRFSTGYTVKHLLFSSKPDLCSNSEPCIRLLSLRQHPQTDAWMIPYAEYDARQSDADSRTQPLMRLRHAKAGTVWAPDSECELPVYVCSWNDLYKQTRDTAIGEQLAPLMPSLSGEAFKKLDTR